MFKKILAAVGGRDASLEPARVAARLAKDAGASLTYISVYREPSSVFGEPDYSDRLHPRLAEVEEMLAEAREAAAGEGITQADYETRSGDPAEVIIDTARDGGYDLVVMGTHRRGRIGVALLGSVSNAVAARSGRPVLVVPEPAKAD